jgi:LCP family protein required for cell wall assembly
LIVITQSPARLIASLVNPTTMTALLVLNGLLLGWRLIAVVQAFLDERHPMRPGRLGAVGLAVLVVAVAAPHTVAHVWGNAAKSAFQEVFVADSGGDDKAGGGGTLPRSDERINILMVGIDKTPTRTVTLTDTLMVLSIDPVGRTVSMLSLPRDLVDMPLGNGDTYVAKLNSLYSFAEQRPDDFPDGGMRALEDAIGTLLQIDIHYYALLDFAAFVTVVDTVGGIDLVVTRGFSDPTYDGYGFAPKHYGFSIEPGRHHFDGVTALAYARSRKAVTETDFTRAARQQEIILALRDKVIESGAVLYQLPALLDSLGKYVRTDMPSARLPELAALADEVPRGSIVRVVLQRPYVKGGVDERGSIQRPVLDKIRVLAKQLFTEPGVLPAPLATPVPSAPAPSASAGP